MWPVKTISYFGLFWMGCLLALANPIWGVVNYMMVYQIHPKETWWGRPLSDMGMRFSMLAIGFTLVGCVTARKYVPAVRGGFCRWEWGVVAFAALGGLTLLLGEGVTPRSAYAFEKLWKMLLFVLIVGRLATTRKNLKLVIWTLVAGCLYIGHDAYTASSSRFWLGRLEDIGGPDFSTTSGTAAHMSAMLPILGIAFLTSRGWGGRVLAAAAGALTINTIIMCRTRSAFIGLICGVLVALFMAPQVRRYRIQLLIVAGTLGGYTLTDGHFWNRMNTLMDRTIMVTDAATLSRTNIWRLSLSMLEDHPLGIGPGNFPAVIGRYDKQYHKRSTHNTLVVCFTELGIVGGSLFLLLAAGSLRYLYLGSKMADESADPVETKILTYGLLVAFVTYFITGLGTERLYCESFWWMLVLPLCLYRVVVSEAHARASVPDQMKTGTVEIDDHYALPGQLSLER